MEFKKEQEVIEKIQKLRDQGLSYQKIADVLNAMGIPSQKGRKWYGNTVYVTMRRAKS